MPTPPPAPSPKYPAWGSPGYPLLPKALRDLWRNERIPPEFRINFSNADIQTFGDLDAHALADGEVATPALLSCLASRLANCTKAEGSTVVIPAEQWDTLNVHRLQCSTRTRNSILNALRHSHTLNPDTATTLRDLLLAPNVGPASAIDFLCAVEVRGENADLLDGYPPDRRADAIAKLNADIHERIDRLNSAFLEDQLLELIRVLGGYNEERSRLLAARLQWNGAAEAITLTQIGEMLGITRERVRQLEGKVLARLSDAEPYLPAIDTVLAKITEAAPMAAADIPALLRRESLGAIDWSPLALREVARLLRREVPYTIVKHSGRQVVLTGEQIEVSREALVQIDRSLSKLGLCRLKTLWWKQERSLIGAPPLVDYCEMLRRLPWYSIFEDEWCWHTGQFSPAIRTPLRRMLTVCPSLDAESVHRGLDRYFRFNSSRLSDKGKGADVELPPLRVLLHYLGHQPEVVVGNDGMISLAKPLSHSEGLPPTDRRIVAIMSAVPGGVISRTDFRSAWSGAGGKPETLDLMLTYSPILQRVSRANWALRGTPGVGEAES